MDRKHRKYRKYRKQYKHLDRTFCFPTIWEEEENCQKQCILTKTNLLLMEDYTFNFYESAVQSAIEQTVKLINAVKSVKAQYVLNDEQIIIIIETYIDSAKYKAIFKADKNCHHTIVCQVNDSVGEVLAIKADGQSQSVSIIETYTTAAAGPTVMDTGGQSQSIASMETDTAASLTVGVKNLTTG